MKTIKSIAKVLAVIVAGWCVVYVGLKVFLLAFGLE